MLQSWFEYIWKHGWPATPPNLGGKRLRYLIGSDGPFPGNINEITEVCYGSPPAAKGISFAYCNLFNENWQNQSETERASYGPYRHISNTASQYHEREIDPSGPGWLKNLNEQFTLARDQGHVFVELDNVDSYTVEDAIRALELANGYGLAVIGKNPLLMDSGEETEYVRRCCALIVERAAGQPSAMDRLRRQADKPDMPVFFVSYGTGQGRLWAQTIARQARDYKNMWVSFSPTEEYAYSEDITAPAD